jgi:tetratricopeptide (TPR) repeat protein
MEYRPEERDDYDFGKRIYRRDSGKKRPYILIAVLAMVLAGIIVMIIYKKNHPKPDLSSLDSPVAPAIGQQQEKPAPAAPPEPIIETETDTDALPGPGYPDLDIDIYGKPGAPTRPGELMKRAGRHFKAGEYQKALPLLEELAALDNRVTVFVGICHYQLANYQQSRDALEDALVIDPASVFALKYLALACYKLDDLEESLRYTESALAIQGDAKLQALYSKLKREIKAMDDYGSAQRVNFNIVFSKLEHSDTRTVVIDILEDAYRTIGQEIDIFPSNPVSVVLYNEKKFFDVTRAPGWAGGLYDGKIRIPIGGMRESDPEVKRILYHEYTHALVSGITSHCPRWLHEGLAEYFSLDRGGTRTIGQVIPLKYLDAAFFTRDVRVTFAAYRQSYSLVTYLVDRYRMYTIKELLEDLGRGTDFDTAFTTAFAISFDRFAETWGKD